MRRIAVDEDVALGRSLQRVPAGEHGAEHGVRVASQRRERRREDLAADVEGNSLIEGVVARLGGRLLLRKPLLLGLECLSLLVRFRAGGRDARLGVEAHAVELLRRRIQDGRRGGI